MLVLRRSSLIWGVPAQWRGMPLPLTGPPLWSRILFYLSLHSSTAICRLLWLVRLTPSSYVTLPFSLWSVSFYVALLQCLIILLRNTPPASLMTCTTLSSPVRSKRRGVPNESSPRKLMRNARPDRPAARRNITKASRHLKAHDTR